MAEDAANRALPAFGFGCGSLMARTGRRESLAILATALDAGFTHFDVARLYGYGEAERVVGEALRPYLGRVTVTTKAGLVPPRGGRALALAKSGARAVTAVYPPARRALRRRAEGMVAGGRFGVDDLRASFDESLRELGTERVDVLLLHEPSPRDLTGEVLELAAKWRESGRIGAFGAAPRREDWPAGAPPDGLDVLQIGDSTADDPVPAPRGVQLITHSSLTRAVPKIVSYLERTGEARSWSERIGADVSSAEVLGRLALVGAARRNPGATLLVASRDRGRIRDNAALLSGERRIDADLDAFSDLARRSAR